MIGCSFASRAVRMQLTGLAHLGKPPVRSDCPVAPVLATSRCVPTRGLRPHFASPRTVGRAPSGLSCQAVLPRPRRRCSA